MYVFVTRREKRGEEKRKGERGTATERTNERTRDVEGGREKDFEGVYTR